MREARSPFKNTNLRHSILLKQKLWSINGYQLNVIPAWRFLKANTEREDGVSRCGKSKVKVSSGGVLGHSTGSPARSGGDLFLG